ncbi:hypothetical protein ACA910_019156 [Epithemia clementina (nom. ined.)]
MLRTVMEDTWSADNDFGEMFLNFWLHPELRMYAGIDLTGLFPEELTLLKRKVLWQAWNRCAMGLSPSPYQATQTAQRVKWLALGSPLDETNVFHWERVVLHLPGNSDYTPVKPWVYRVCQDGNMAADVHPYVDDMRETAPSELEAWTAASQIAKAASYYGLQDAAPKRRPPSQTPGAWAGALIITGSGGMYKLVSNERWYKVKTYIATLIEWSQDERVARKPLEKIQGFLVYVTLMYSTMLPYLKGLHLTLESWREDRDEDGWKMTPRERALVNRGDDEARDVVGGNYNPNLKTPDMVVPAPRFKDDVRVLFELTKASHPPRILVRLTGQAIAALMFGDASGTGFGTLLWLQGSSEVHAEHGIWTKAYGARSSNFRELYNLVSWIESLSKEGTIQEGTELFVFTDNSTAESAFYKGTSTSKLLFSLVV